MVAGCGSTNPAPNAQAQVPTDGVHIAGAFTGVYPISSGGKCNVATLNADKILQFTANATTGAAVGMQLIKYTGPKTYAPLDWPAYQSSAMWVGLIGGHTWHAFSGWVKVASDVNGTISGTLSSTGMQEVGGTTTVNASGSWTCQVSAPLTGVVVASPSPSPGSVPPPSPSPLPSGTPVARQVLVPAKVMPAVSLCSLPIQQYQDGNAGPLFCSNGLNVEAWKYFGPAEPHVLGAGPSAAVKDVQAAICADGSINHATRVMEESGYLLARAYYGWTFSFDYWAFQDTGTCP